MECLAFRKDDREKTNLQPPYIATDNEKSKEIREKLKNIILNPFICMQNQGKEEQGHVIPVSED